MIAIEQLIAEIKLAFKNVKLEDGIGLWEAQGLDDYANESTMQKLKAKDERMNWENLAYQDLAYCESSLSFFDAKGMRFCLPKFLIFDILEIQIQQEKNLSSPELLFTLTFHLDDEYQQNRFSLFNKAQVQSIISFLNYKLAIATKNEDEFSISQIVQALKHWQNKLQTNQFL